MNIADLVLDFNKKLAELHKEYKLNQKEQSLIEKYNIRLDWYGLGFWPTRRKEERIDMQGYQGL